MQHGLYVDSEAVATEVLLDLEAVEERLAQLSAAAKELRGFQEVLALVQDSFPEVDDAQRAVHTRC